MAPGDRNEHAGWRVESLPDPSDNGSNRASEIEPDFLEIFFLLSSLIVLKRPAIMVVFPIFLVDKPTALSPKFRVLLLGMMMSLRKEKKSRSVGLVGYPT